MLNRGRCRLMNCCSARSASASVSVTRKSIDPTRPMKSSPPRCGPEKCDATRLRIEVALPTYSTPPSGSLNMYTPGWSGSCFLCSLRLCGLSAISTTRLGCWPAGQITNTHPTRKKPINAAAPPSPPELETMRIDVDGDIGTLTLDRPKVLNAQSPELIGELVTAAGWLADRAPLRGLIVTGAGRAFSAGGDVTWFKRGLEESGEYLSADVRRGAEVLHQAIVDFRRIPYPVVGAVNGVAAGAGFSLALMCDVRIASEDAAFVCAYGRIGASPDGGMTYFLPRVVGPARALELLLEDPILSAEQARNEGLVTEVVPADRLLDAARERAEELAARAPHYVRMSKLLVSGSLENSLAEHLQLERHGIADSMATRDLREGVSAFLEGRQATFQGR